MSYGRFILVAIPPTAYDIVRLDGSLVIEAGESLLHCVEQLTRTGNYRWSI